MPDPGACAVASIKGLDKGGRCVFFHARGAEADDDDDGDEARIEIELLQILDGGDPKKRLRAAQPGPGECAVCVV